MDLAAFFKDNWRLISSEPATFTVFGLVLITVTAVVTRIVLGGALDANRERLEGAKEEIARLKGEKDELIRRLESHGEDIAKLKTDLAALPRIHVSDRPPKPGDMTRDGDIWLQYDKDAKNE